MADHDDLFVHTTRDLLIAAGFRCDRVCDAQEALEAIARHPYELVITDIGMPGNSDLSLVRKIRALRKGLPVIIATGLASLDAAIEAVELPVLCYLLKPFEFERLLEAVRAGVEQHRMYTRVSAWASDTSAFAETIAAAPEWIVAPAPIGKQESAVTFLRLAARNATRSLYEMARMLDAAESSHPGLHRVPCQLLACPRGQRYRGAIEQCVAVLERTKSAFKSRELADLRQMLEAILDEDRE